MGLITYYMGDLYRHLLNLMVPPQRVELIYLRLNHFNTVLPHALSPPPPPSYLPVVVLSMLATIPDHPASKLTPLPPPSENLRAALPLYHLYALDPHMPSLRSLPHTVAVDILHTASPRGSREKTDHHLPVPIGGPSNKHPNGGTQPPFPHLSGVDISK